MPPLRPRRLAAAALAAAAVVAVTAAPAAACGGLVGENGSIQLTRTSTLAAYHDGVERYVTSFEFTGTGESVGSIIPLPGIPDDVVRGGDWTLQRLAQEVAPPSEGDEGGADAAGFAAASAEVILETQIDALDITVLRGGGDEVGTWARDNGFLLTPDAPEMLDFYGHRSEIFMAARFDASRAAELGQTAGDGTPDHAHHPHRRPVGAAADPQPRPRRLRAGGGRRVPPHRRRARPAGGWARPRPSSAASRRTTSLLDDLRSDVGMEWVPEEMWFTYLAVDAEARDLDYDLAVSADGSTLPSLADTGVAAPEARPISAPGAGLPLWPLVAGAVVALALLVVLLGSDRRGTGVPA